MLNITAIPALRDNYIWAIHNQHHVVIIDPGAAQPVLDFLKDSSLELDAILCTHRHADHIGGVEKLCAVYNVPVYGRKHPKNPVITHNLSATQPLSLTNLDLTFTIIDVPGHLDDHIAYYAPGMLFCGDIIFGAGCGRNFEGHVNELYQSIYKLSQLPDDTLIYCSHEYTALNLPFAARCEPHNQAIQKRIQDMQHQTRTVPFTLALEKASNPFLRCNTPELRHTLQQQGMDTSTPQTVFAALRTWRDNF